ncbi:flagellar export protein FliJ [Sporosarcina gallistercoris]|uniref:Flagellar FliJ protein n=1 Tax=Sporosarcina gallistercoris TaxID=2762245 RepID=A0ABR8PG40_9BACL|nr:flagellar export protein FliJ [Sporosarcina gallistercoris]MBD7907130.1 flagellar export protein FliJ [Sporosarcina gallistercoris]
MKSYHYRFDKVLTFREQEKNETESAYKESIESFETIATQLYDLLKKKEDILVEQQEKMARGFSVNEIHHYARFIESIEAKINSVQEQVIQARSKMNWYEERLLDKTIEVKKYEKMREKDRDAYQEEMEHKEAERLDELSTLKFRKNENGW